MVDSSADPEAPAGLSDSPALADALENERFRKFLDHVPFAVENFPHLLARQLAAFKIVRRDEAYIFVRLQTGIHDHDGNLGLHGVIDWTNQRLRIQWRENDSTDVARGKITIVNKG